MREEGRGKGEEQTRDRDSGLGARGSVEPESVATGGTEPKHEHARHAVAVDADIKEKNLLRLRRIEGQMRGLQKMVEEERYCADILVQISSVHEALRAVSRELMRNHLKHCATAAIRSEGMMADAMYNELVELMYKHVR
jgi:CsoR family transcriptional regulator, copper-sensing transcriptional repressor